MNDAVLLCIKFDFGVPLEDIFPRNDIHPRLQNLLWQTWKALKNSELSLNKILNQFEGSLCDILQMKDILINGNLSYREDMSPCSFFWLLRHFLGLLPLPLFPRFANGEVYNWEYLSAKCKLNNHRRNYELESEISWTIHKLPKANITLIYSLMNFLRKICLRSGAVRKLEKHKVSAVTIYFSSSIFLRPYTPGLMTTTDRLFHPLLFFLIVNWSRIRRKEDDKFRYVELSSIWEIEETNDGVVKTCEDILRKEVMECSCQTSSCLLVDQTNNQEESFLEEEKELEYAEKFDVGNKEEKDAEGGGGEEPKVENLPINETLGSKNKLSGSDENEEPIQEISAPEYEEPPAYEEIAEPNVPLSSSNSETAICQKGDRKFLTPKILKQKFVKANVSLASVFSKVNEKLKSKQELFSKSGGKLDNYKYDLLKDPKVVKVQSLHADRCVKDSPSIKYKKLMTI